jgi:hypothetical protein
LGLEIINSDFDITELKMTNFDFNGDTAGLWASAVEPGSKLGKIKTGDSSAKKSKFTNLKANQ